MKVCPVCAGKVSTLTVKCPHCGKQLSKDWRVTVVLTVVTLVGVGYYLGPYSQKMRQERAALLDWLASAPASDLQPTGRLAQAFKLGSDNTDLQRENIEREITGQIVLWTLPVYEVSKRRDGYRIQTSGDNAIFFGEPLVGVFATVYPRSERDDWTIAQLKTGMSVTFKGQITGTSVRYIEIDPAILVDSTFSSPQAEWAAPSLVAAGRSLETVSAANARGDSSASVTCSDVESYSAQWQSARDLLEPQMQGGYMNRNHDTVVYYLCEGDSEGVDGIVDGGQVSSEDAKRIAKALGKSYIPAPRTSAGLAYQAARAAFHAMNLCSACEDNVARFYLERPDSQCGKLAQRAIGGDRQAIELLKSGPDYCRWPN